VQSIFKKEKRHAKTDFPSKLVVAQLEGGVYPLLIR